MAHIRDRRHPLSHPRRSGSGSVLGAARENPLVRPNRFTVGHKRLRASPRVRDAASVGPRFHLEDETVLDFAMGSGTTGIACKNLNRKFIGMELDPEYFKIAEERLS